MSLLDEIQPKLTSSGKPRGFPNTYTFTKFLAENIVDNEGKNLPRAIVRPSIGKFALLSTFN